jgi:hypothetical protein
MKRQGRHNGVLVPVYTNKFRNDFEPKYSKNTVNGKNEHKYLQNEHKQEMKKALN